MGLHLERLVTRFQEEGFDETEARWPARIEFGAVYSLREEARDAPLLGTLGRITQTELQLDLRDGGSRTLSRTQVSRVTHFQGHSARRLWTHGLLVTGLGAAVGATLVAASTEEMGLGEGVLVGTLLAGVVSVVTGV
jgi:hypothetical protein